MAKAFPNINLVGFRVGIRRLKKQRQVWSSRISIIALVAFLIVFLPVMIIRASYASKKTTLTEKLDDLTQEISTLRARETKIALLDQKSRSLMTLEKDRLVVQPKILEIYDVIPEGSYIDEVSFGEGGSFLNVSVNAPDVFVVGDVFDNVTGQVPQRFKQVAFKSTKRSADGAYKVSMEIHFGGEKNN